MTSSSSQGSAGNIPGQFGMEAVGGNTVFLSPDLFLSVAVLLGEFSRISEDGKLIVLMISSILLDCLCEEL